MRRGFDDRSDLAEALAYQVDADARGEQLAGGYEAACPSAACFRCVFGGGCRRRALPACADQMRDPREYILYWWKRRSRAVGIDDVLETPGALDERIAARSGYGALAFTNSAQVVLEMMGQLLCRPQLDHRRNRLQCVEVTEQVVDGGALGRRMANRLVQPHKRIRGCTQVFFGLREVIIQEAVEECVPSGHRYARGLASTAASRRSLTACARVCGANGFVR